MRKEYIFGAIIVIIIVGAAIWAMGQSPQRVGGDIRTAEPNEDEQVFCTMDAMMCPDGSYVGRIPPSCEFAACPGNGEGQAPDDGMSDGGGALPTQMSITGTYACLPHADKTGPQSEECAYGIQEASTEQYYAFDLSVIQFHEGFEFETGQEAVVEGRIIPIDQIQVNQWSKYDIAGVITVTGIR